MSLKIKAKIIHTLVFPITMYKRESWTAKKTDREKQFISNMVLEGSSPCTLDYWKVDPG